MIKGTSLCAKLVNVTGACERRRGLWKEEPIVISFDEDADEAAKILFTSIPPSPLATATTAG